MVANFFSEASTSKIYHVNMRVIFVDMQLNFVNMKLTSIYLNV